MSCGCGGGGGNIQTAPQKTTLFKITPPEECSYDEAVLNSYKKLLTAVEDHMLHSKVKLSQSNINAYKGVIQSALNYPDNYCVFEQQLDNFKFTILPKLIEHVSEYID